MSEEQEKQITEEDIQRMKQELVVETSDSDDSEDVDVQLVEKEPIVINEVKTKRVNPKHNQAEGVVVTLGGRRKVGQKKEVKNPSQQNDVSKIFEDRSVGHSNRTTYRVGTTVFNKENK